MKLTGDNLYALNQMKLSSKELRINLESLLEKKDSVLNNTKLSIALHLLSSIDSIFESGLTTK